MLPIDEPEWKLLLKERLMKINRGVPAQLKNTMRDRNAKRSQLKTLSTGDKKLNIDYAIMLMVTLSHMIMAVPVRLFHRVNFSRRRLHLWREVPAVTQERLVMSNYTSLNTQGLLGTILLRKI